MRKVHCYTDSLLAIYYKEFVRDTNKFFRASKLTLEHMNVEFSYKGSKWKIIGHMDAKEMVCRKDDGEIWTIDRQEVQKAILGSPAAAPVKTKKMKPVVASVE